MGPATASNNTTLSPIHNIRLSCCIVRNSLQFTIQTSHLPRPAAPAARAPAAGKAVFATVDHRFGSCVFVQRDDHHPIALRGARRCRFDAVGATFAPTDGLVAEREGAGGPVIRG